MKTVGKICAVLLCALAAMAIGFTLYYFSVTSGLRLDGAKLTLAENAAVVYDCNGKEVADLTPSGKETACFTDLPDYLPNAFVSVEDKRFYSHGGIDAKRMVKAALKNIASFSFREGASTISQQLIKNTHLTSEKTLSRKLKEIKLTLMLEKKYSKEEILELYLNSIYFGHGIFGIENASQFYFGKSAQSLDIAESAMLAALVKSPNRYSPFKNAEKCLTRRNFILGLMQEQGYISAAEADEAKSRTLPEEPVRKEKSAYFACLTDELAELYPELRSGEFSDMKIYTYYDPKLQKAAEIEVSQSDHTVAVVDNASRSLCAFASSVGSIRRLPASTVKPLLVYAPAIEENLVSPATPILDEAVDFNGYRPANYGGKYGGYMSVRYALSRSVNVPAVKTMNALTPKRAAEYARKLALPIEEEDETLTLALGGMKNGFTLKELCDAYSTFANGGNFAPSAVISRIERDGKIIYQRRSDFRRVYSEETSFLINDMLKTAAKEGTAKKLSTLPFEVCAKTGTGSDASGKTTDAYTVAYTQQHTVAVWLGNADNSPVQTTGGGLPADYAKQILSKIYADKDPSPFFTTDGVETVALDREAYEKRHALVAEDDNAPPFSSIKEYFKKENAPKEKSMRFTEPSIEKPKITVNNSTVCIELCQTEYYDYIINREHDGTCETIYEGSYRNKIYDSSLSPSVTYTYTVIPCYQGKQGKPEQLPSVRLSASSSVPDEWWDD